jgi:hypothetical protein
MVMAPELGGLIALAKSIARLIERLAHGDPSCLTGLAEIDDLGVELRLGLLSVGLELLDLRLDLRLVLGMDFGRTLHIGVTTFCQAWACALARASNAACWSLANLSASV